MSEDLRVFLEDLVDFVNGLEASCVKLRRQIEKLLGSEVKAVLSEDTFNILRWVDEKGERLGDFQVAYKQQNLADNWLHAFNILKVNNSFIANRFHEKGYVYAYWIFPDKYPDRIFKKKLTEKEVKG